MKTEMTLEDVEILNQIKTFKKAGPAEVALMQNFMAKYIDNKATVCPTCPGQIRFAHSRIINWATHNQAMIDEVSTNPLDKAKKEVEKYSAAHTCKCGAELKDKRRKQCKECKDGK